MGQQGQIGSAGGAAKAPFSATTPQSCRNARRGGRLAEQMILTARTMFVRAGIDSGRKKSEDGLPILGAIFSRKKMKITVIAGFARICALAYALSLIEVE